MNYKLEFVKIGPTHEVAGVGFAGNIFIIMSALYHLKNDEDRMYVDMDGSIFDTVCKQRTQTGSIYTGYTLPTEPMICKQNFCWCHSDINAKKIKITPI